MINSSVGDRSNSARLHNKATLVCEQWKAEEKWAEQSEARCEDYLIGCLGDAGENTSRVTALPLGHLTTGVATGQVDNMQNYWFLIPMLLKMFCRLSDRLSFLFSWKTPSTKSVLSEFPFDFDSSNLLSSCAISCWRCLLNAVSGLI